MRVKYNHTTIRSYITGGNVFRVYWIPRVGRPCSLQHPWTYCANYGLVNCERSGFFTARLFPENFQVIKTPRSLSITKTIYFTNHGKRLGIINSFFHCLESAILLRLYAPITFNWQIWVRPGHLHHNHLR